MDKIRILHLTCHMNFGGAEIMIRNLVKHIDRKIFEPFVVTWLGGELEEDLIKMGVRVLRVPSQPKLVRLRSISKLLKEQDIDILHAHLFSGGFYGRLATIQNRNIGVVRTHHGMTFKKKTFRRIIFETLLYPLSNYNIAVSDSVKRHINSTLLWKQGRLRVIDNGVDIKKFHTDRQKFNSIPTIVTAGRLSQEKGFDVLIHALHILSQNRINFKCLLAGDGPEYKKLSTLVKKFSLSNFVKFQGNVHDIVPLLKAGDLFILPSYHEGLPLALLEAMASGLPVVASEVGGIPDVLTPETGWLVPPGEPKALANAIQNVFENPSIALKKAQTGLINIMGKYTMERTIKEYENLYLKMISGKRNTYPDL